ncbi:MAG: 3,4-dihydroxy-2-butanone-4-phosphate synthase [Nitrospira sp.]
MLAKSSMFNGKFQAHILQTMTMTAPFDTIENAIRDIKKGKCIILVDDEDRENEGDLVIAAEKVTPRVINFMATHARGLICLALTPERVLLVSTSTRSGATQVTPFVRISHAAGEPGSSTNHLTATLASMTAVIDLGPLESTSWNPSGGVSVSTRGFGSPVRHVLEYSEPQLGSQCVPGVR